MNWGSDSLNNVNQALPKTLVVQNIISLLIFLYYKHITFACIGRNSHPKGNFHRSRNMG
ncbi:hypothetical protein Lalb_Chr18g0054821 [Lupinus albus]|uniref:Uncharacterized protein n=1 Tax=Lupinus albus TaxID=3870 RepID=A0A6A4NV21_LUPAL|nr:hypothetical protein Lalb_Chr18g0054821 [Lupinus albus]